MNRHHHFILHKPYGYLSQFVTKDKSKKKLLGELHDFPEGIMAVGRLDADSEGLLFLTTDGVTSDRVRSKTVEKEYHVQLDGLISDDAISQLQKGVEIGFEGKRYYTKPCQVVRIDEPENLPDGGRNIRMHRPASWISIILTEGKFRQVRKMTAAVGFPTLRLIRVRIGKEKLHDLPVGDIREVKSFRI